jgi:outer membrane immunogenic protein
MKRLLLATTVLAGLTAVASAADLPRRAAPPVFVPVPVFTWTGFYAGINAGYAFDAGKEGPNSFPVASRFTAAGTPQVATFSKDSQDGFSGGAQIGYNYQFTPGSGVVVGIEADAQYVDFGRERNRFSATGPLAAQQVFNPAGVSGLDYFGTVRGRLGYAFDRTLVYGTGGFAYGSGSADRSFGGYAGNDSFRTGYAVGGGIEYALPTDSFLNFFRSSAVTLKVEGLYVNLDRGTRNQGVLLVNAANLAPAYVTPIGRRDDEFAVVRAGLNYKFGSY